MDQATKLVLQVKQDTNIRVYEQFLKLLRDVRRASNTHDNKDDVMSEALFAIARLFAPYPVNLFNQILFYCPNKNLQKQMRKKRRLLNGLNRVSDSSSLGGSSSSVSRDLLPIVIQSLTLSALVRLRQTCKWIRKQISPKEVDKAMMM